MFNIYHIPTFVHKDGSIGKIGCTTRPKARVEEQGYSSFEILETHDCIDSVSVRELELQKEYGYKVDTIPYWKVYKQREQLRSFESCSKGGKIGGKVTGAKAQKEGIGFFGASKQQVKKWRSKPRPYRRKLTEQQEKFIKEHYYKVNNQHEKIPKGKLTTSQLCKMFNVNKFIVLRCVKRD